MLQPAYIAYPYLTQFFEFMQVFSPITILIDSVFLNHSLFNRHTDINRQIMLYQVICGSSLH